VKNEVRSIASDPRREFIEARNEDFRRQCRAIIARLGGNPFHAATESHSSNSAPGIDVPGTSTVATGE
jgi:hypothetical protein